MISWIVVLIISGAVILGILLALAGWVFGGYNTLQTGRQNIKTMFSNIKTEYQRRADLFYNLAEAVKSHANFEKSTLVEVIAMRNGNFGNTPKEAQAKIKSLEGFMSKLMVVFERYPKLKSNEHYQSLMKEVRITEDRINIARTEYNDTVRDYNLFVVRFPSNFLAGMFNFKEEEYFENEPETNKAPKMNLKI